MGKVIIAFDPETFMDRLAITDEKDRGLLKEKIYDSPLWKQMDHGDLDEQRMIEIVEPELPEHVLAERIQRLEAPFHICHLVFPSYSSLAASISSQ